ncbi:Alpha/Beta hydrolase protein, partial [Staphylotrichum tortipilum]
KPQARAAPYGIALGFHGGGFVIGSRYFIPEAEIAYLAEAGFLVVSADYRLCPQVALYDAIEDAIDAFSWCKTELPAKLSADVGISVDGRKIVAFGQSAGGLLALHLGTLPEPPAAILDFYGVKYTSDEFWHKPLPALAMIPPFPRDFLDRIHDEPTQTTTVTSLERVSALQAKKNRRGMPAPDFSLPRNAWLFTALAEGTHLKAVVKDCDFERIDPARLFHPGFPPTFFLHGDADDMVLTEFSKRAHEHLGKQGVVAELGLVPGTSHGFDAGISQEDQDWPQVRQGLDFIIRQAGLGV